MDKIIVILTSGLMLICGIITLIIISPVWIIIWLCDKIMNRVRLAWKKEDDKSLRQKIGIGLGQLESECGDLVSDIKADGRKRLNRKGEII